MTTIKITVDSISTANAGLRAAEPGIGNKGWINYSGDDKENIQRKLRDIVKGDVVELLMDETGFIDVINVTSASSPIRSIPGIPYEVHSSTSKIMPTITSTFAIKNHRDSMDEYVTFSELLHKLKEESKGEYSIENGPVTIDTEKKIAVFKAHVKAKFGEQVRWVTAHGDCTQDNGGVVKEHYIRMAETRAVARALRMILGIGATAEEEK